MHKNKEQSYIIASSLAMVLILSVFSTVNAFASSSSFLHQPGESSDKFDQVQTNNNEDDDNDDDNNNSGNNSHEKGKGKNDDSSDSANEDDDNSTDNKSDDKKDHHGKKVVHIKSNKGRGHVQVSENEDNDNNDKGASVEFPADFIIKATDGTAIQAGGNARGSSSQISDVSLSLNASTIRANGNNIKVDVYGSINLDGKKLNLSDGTGTVIFFKNPAKQFFSGIIHISGHIEGQVNTDNNNHADKFHMRAVLLLPSTSDNNGQADGKNERWSFYVTPAAKIGPKIKLLNLVGELIEVDGGNNGSQQPPTSNKSLDHFRVQVATEKPSSAAVFTAGKLFNVTVTALDRDGKVVKSYEGKANVTDLTGTVTPKTTTKFAQGIFKGKLNITKSMNSDKLTFTDPDTKKKGTSDAFNVKPASLAKVDLRPSTVTIKPGKQANFTASALDKFGNALSSIPSGTNFAWSSSSANFGSIATSGSKANFTASTSVVSPKNVTITVTLGSLTDSSLISIKPNPAESLDHFVIAEIKSPKKAGSGFLINITALDDSDHVITGYSNDININDTTSTLKVVSDNGFSNGVWTGTVNITKAAKNVKIIASDKDSPAKKGTSNSFEVNASNLDHFVISGIQATETAGSEFEFDVTAMDSFANVVTNYNGTVSLSTNVGPSPAGNTSSITPNPYTFNSTAGDKGEHEFKAKLYNAKTNAIITVQSGAKTGTSNTFNVVASPTVAGVKVSPHGVTLSPGQKATFSAEAKDAYGNAITGATFSWSLNSTSLGSLSATSGLSVELTAPSSVSELLNGYVTAASGSKSDNATIQVTTS
jgi:hypothetical protein